jgi:ribonuclease-3
MSNSNIVQIVPYNERNFVISQKEVVDLIGFDEIVDVHNINFYRRAFVHKSYCTRKNENFIEGNVNCPPNVLPLQEESNERIEFLGDAILNLAVANYLFERYPDVNEGFLTTMRTKLVNGNMLAFLSTELNLGKYLIISQQIEQNNGRDNKNILEDVFEAFIGAIFLDFEQSHNKGFQFASRWIVNKIEEHVDFTELMKTSVNYKDKLVKLCQHQYQFIPKFYEIDIKETRGTKEHTVCVKNNMSEILGVGKGINKKLAEIEASKKALKYYGAI